MPSSLFHPAVAGWFAKTFPAPTAAQLQAWPAIKQGRDVLIAAPTGSGKTLAAFLSAIDDLVKQGLAHGLPDETRVLYVSPLRALSNDIQKNLEEPLCGIADALNESGLPSVNIRAMVRTGDTTQMARNRMRREPPHILVTTPESLFILLTSESGRRMLSTVRTVIVDEIHAMLQNKRGSHLALSLERLEALTAQPPVRIGLSATQRPIGTVAKFLLGNRERQCAIVDTGHVRRRDLALELPSSPLEPVMATEVWTEVYDRLAQLIGAHRTTLIFVNTRRAAERTARCLGERLGDECVTSHHGSLAREHRLDAEQRLKAGKLKALVATASLELGIDIGNVDLVCQLGSPRSIAALLQRVGRSGHSVGGTPKGRLFPLSRDDLIECAALLDAVRRDELDLLHVPPGHVDVLAQQIIAETACADWNENALFEGVTRAWPYRDLPRARFDVVLDMLAEGFSTRRGRRSRYVQRDAVNGMVRGRPGARLTAVTNAGAIPDQFDYDVILEPDGHFIGTVNEDFAFESLPGDIFQLGNTSWRVRKVENGKLRVEDARGQPPNMPFWLGEAPGRTNELSVAVSGFRKSMDARLADGVEPALRWLEQTVGLEPSAARQITEYLATAKAALGLLPTHEDVIFERFFDETGDQHLVIHSSFGSRLNRAWGLALRKRFCRKFNFELQAAALEDSIVISLGATHSFPLPDVTNYLNAATVREVVTQALLAVPMFMTHWRWNASIALAIRRNSGGKRVPAQFQRMDAEDLVAVVFPDQMACQDNLAGEREIPSHPLVDQTIEDCLHGVMDIAGLEAVLRTFENGSLRIHCRDLGAPSPLAQEILSARPYAFLDDAPAEERRTRAVQARRFSDPSEAAELGRLDPAAIAKVRAEAWPEAVDVEEMHDALMQSGFILESELQSIWPVLLDQLAVQRRAAMLESDGAKRWVCAERLSQLRAVFPEASLTPAIEAAGPATKREWQHAEALVELARSRLESSGPVATSELQRQFQCGAAELAAALTVLEVEGYAMRGRYTGGADSGEEWCERSLLARIHRYTLQKLRAEIEPVSAQEFMRFLFQWHGIGPDRPGGEDALLSVIEQLEGFPIPAAAWESDVLPARLDAYSSDMLDRLCAAGHVQWLRLFSDRTRFESATVPARSTVIRNTPITLLPRRHGRLWRELHPLPVEKIAEALSTPARTIFDALRQHGALFFLDLVQQGGLLRTQTEDALAELAANGLLTADSYSGLRALLMPAAKRPGYGRERRRGRVLVNEFDDAGRWSLPLRHTTPAETKSTGGFITTDMAVLEHVAQVLLRRYGVVFRKVLERETLLPPWRELLYVLRRLEARGDVRGGRFVAGFSGEQFALPEAVGLLRNQRQKPSGGFAVISAADPLNLIGAILPGERISSPGSVRIAFRDGVPVARQSGGDIEFMIEIENTESWQIRNLFTRRKQPASYLPTPPSSN